MFILFRHVVSKLIYQVVNLRQIVKAHHQDDNNDAHIKSKKTKVQFNHPALIETSNTEEGSSIHGFKKPTLKREITSMAIKMFINSNKDRLTTSSCGDIAFKNPSKKEEIKDDNGLDALEELLDQLGDTFDADVIEFDDEFSDRKLKSELVFSIIVNR